MKDAVVKRRYLNQDGRPVNEQGQRIDSETHWSQALTDFWDKASERDGASSSLPSKADYARTTRAKIEALEPFRDRIVDKGELEEASAFVELLREFADDAETPAPPPSEAFKRAMEAASRGDAADGSAESRIDAIHRALVEVHQHTPEITERSEKKQVSARLSGLLRLRMAIVSSMTPEERADWVSHGGLPDLGDYLEAAQLNADNVARRQAQEEESGN